MAGGGFVRYLRLGGRRLGCFGLGRIGRAGIIRLRVSLFSATSAKGAGKKDEAQGVHRVRSHAEA